MSAAPHEECITCSGALAAMTVVSVQAEQRLAECIGEDGGACTVDTSLLGAAAAGEVLLVHAGAALARAGAPCAPLPPPDGAGSGTRRG